MVSYLTREDKRTKKIIKEKNFQFEDVKPIGHVPFYKLHESHFPALSATVENMMESKHPYVVILAFCFTHESILKAMLMEMGVLAILSAKAEMKMI